MITKNLELHRVEHCSDSRSEILMVEDHDVADQLSYAIKTQLKAPLPEYFLPFAVSLRHKDA